MYIAIIDDSAADRTQCRRMIEDYSAAEKIPVDIEEFETGKELLFKKDHSLPEVDLVMLDIMMPEPDGMETAAILRESGYEGELVFFTKSADYALSAFDVSAMHYLVKRASSENSERLHDILDRVYLNSRRRSSEVVIFSCAGERRAIRIEDIWYFEIQKRIVTVHYLDKTFSFYTTMLRLTEMMEGRGFVRTHKSFLVNAKYINRINQKEALLANGTVLPVGRKYFHPQSDEIN